MSYDETMEDEMTQEEYEELKDFEEYCREIEKLNPGCTGGM